MSSILKGLSESYSRDEQDQQNAMDTRRSTDLSRERNAGLNEPNELPTTSVETRNGVYEYNVPEGQEKLAQDLGLQYHKGHWVSRMPFQRADFQFGRPQFHEILGKGVAEDQIDELSNKTLASYKKKAGADASQADKRGDYARGNKRMSGIVKATKKEFDNDSKHIKESAMLQGIMLTESRTYKLWESAGQKLNEAQLTADQINQIFQQVQQGATAAGGNRTMLGRGKDAASAVNKAWEDLKTKVQDSGPIKGVDAMYDKAAEQLKQATGGDQGVMQYVQKYRDFAKKHPVAQGLIYSALIAAAGISGAGIGGAAALGLFKLVDKLLQGERFSSAAYSGAKTGAMAYGASKVGDLIKGSSGGTPPSGGSDAASAAGTYGDVYRHAFKQGAGAARQAIESGQITNYNSVLDVTDQIMASIGTELSPQSYEIIEKMVRAKLWSAIQNESVELSESQIHLFIGKIVERQRKLDEGIMDTVKGAAGKAVDWAKTKGTNLTTKVTADKLLQAWKKAGSPTDSLDVAKIIQNAGVPSDTIKQVYGSMKIPFAGEPGGGAMPQAAPKAGATPQSAQPAAKAGTAPQMAQPVAKAAVPQAVAKAAPQAVQPVAKAGTVPGYNAANVMKLPGMEKYAKPAPAKTANFGGGPTGYASVNTTFKQPTVAPAKQPTMAEEDLEENLHKWFQEKWVRFGPDGKIRGDCARGDDSEGKPKCLPQSKAQNLGKKGRASAAARKRREDPNPERSGKAINVNTKKKTNEAELDEACWKGYHKEGNKKMFGKTYPNCVKNTNEEQELDEYGDTSKGQKMLAKVHHRAVDRVTSKKADTDPKYAKKNQDTANAAYDRMTEEHHSESCPHCGGEMVSEELMNEKKDACYYKVKSRYKVWPSAYASGALVKCRKSGADSWGNGGKSNESIEEGDVVKFPKKHKSDLEDTHSCVKCGGDLQGGTYMGHKVKVCMPCKQVYLPPNTGIDNRGNKIDEQGVAEDQLDEKWTKKYKDSINCSNPKGFSQKAHCAGKQKNESAIMKGLKL